MPATHNIAAGERAFHDKQLAAGVADTITFDTPTPSRVEVMSDGAAALYFTVDGTPATVGCAHCFRLPPGSVSALTVDVPDGKSLSLISAGTPEYSVTKVDWV